MMEKTECGSGPVIDIVCDLTADLEYLQNRKNW